MSVVKFFVHEDPWVNEPVAIFFSLRGGLPLELS